MTRGIQHLALTEAENHSKSVSEREKLRYKHTNVYWPTMIKLADWLSINCHMY